MSKKLDMMASQMKGFKNILKMMEQAILKPLISFSFYSFKNKFKFLSKMSMV